MKRLLLLLGTLLLMPTGAMSQERPIERGIGPGRPSKPSRLLWRSFTIKGEEFSVALPTFPTMTTRKTSQARLGKDRVERELKASSGGVIYSVDIFENPEPRQSLAEFIAEQNANSEYDLATESNLTVNGFTGKQYSSVNKTSPATVQFFATEERLYRFTASGKVAEDDAVREFFSSISFGKETAVVEVPDNPDERIFTGREVETKARLTSKPEPNYTEEARKNGISGTVVLRAVFSAEGKVVNIRVVSGLPHGLTERAINAAKNIKFFPATKDGKPVSMWMQLEYNFDPYR